jgi:hypothetical protein
VGRDVGHGRSHDADPADREEETKVTSEETLDRVVSKISSRAALSLIGQTLSLSKCLTPSTSYEDFSFKCQKFVW